MSFHTGQTFTYGEQPSATKWQYLWDNDYALADGEGFSTGSGSVGIQSDSLRHEATSSPSVTVSGIAAAGSSVIVKEFRIFNLVFLIFNVSGTSNSTSFIISGLTHTAANTAYNTCFVKDNGTIQSAPGRAQVQSGTTDLVFDKNVSSVNWTSSGAKQAYGTIVYEATP